MSRLSLAGAAALLAGPLTMIVGGAVIPTLSDDTGKQIAALAGNRQAMLTGMTLQTITIVLMIAGTIWLALALAPRAPKLASIGGVLAVLGGLIVLFVDSVHAGAAAAVLGVDPAQGTAIFHRITSSAAVSAFEPLQVVQDVGLVLLAIATTKAGAPRRAAAAIVLGTIGESAGFGTGSRPLVIAAFAVLLAGLVPAVRALVAARPAGRRVESVEAAVA